MKKEFRQRVFVFLFCAVIMSYTGCGSSDESPATASLLVTLFDKSPGTEVTVKEISDGRYLPTMFSGTITFSEAMDPVSVESATTITKGDTELVLASTLDLTWNDDNTAVTFIPHKDLEYDASYTVAISAEAKAVSGASLTEFSVPFSIARYMDVNGDGYAEIYVDAFGYKAGVGTGRSYIFHGGDIPTGKHNVNNSDALILDASNPAKQVSAATMAMTDFNRDGFADLLCMDFDSTTHAPHIGLIMGSDEADAKLAKNPKKNPLTVADVDVSWARGEEGNYNSFNPIDSGDFNDDNYLDVAIIDSTCGSDKGCIYIDYGPILPSITPRTISDMPTFTGENVTSTLGGTNYQVLVGDINDDGIDDLIVSSNNSDSNRGAVYVFYGSKTNWKSKSASKADIIIRGEAKGDDFSWLSFSLSNYGRTSQSWDVNGDGISDLVVSAPDYGAKDLGRIYVFLGGKDSTLVTSAAKSATHEVNASTADTTFTGVVDDSKFGTNFTFGDVNGDKKLDLVTGADYSLDDDDKGHIYVFLQPESGFSSGNIKASTALPEIDSKYTQLGPVIDLDSDGVDDITLFITKDSECGDLNETVLTVQGGADIVSPNVETWTLCSGDPDQTFLPILDFRNGIGDFFGDGTRALFFGTPEYSSNKGIIYLVSSSDVDFGKTTMIDDLAVQLTGENNNDKLGE